MLDKYSRIEELILAQKEKKEFVVSVFKEIFEQEIGLATLPALKIEFSKSSDNIVLVKVSGSSSVKFSVKNNRSRIINKFKQKYPDFNLNILC